MVTVSSSNSSSSTAVLSCRLSEASGFKMRIAAIKWTTWGATDVDAAEAGATSELLPRLTHVEQTNPKFNLHLPLLVGESIPHCNTNNFK